MNPSCTIKSIKKAYQHVENKLRPFVSPILDWLHCWSEAVRLGVRKPHALAYRVVGEKIHRILPLFRDMDKNLRKSGKKISFRAYVSLAIGMTLLVSISILAALPFFLVSILGIPPIPSVLLGVGASLFAGAFVVIGFYVYPIYRADSLRRSLEDGLPFTTGYMAILASAEVPPHQIFRSVAQVDSLLAVSNEAKTVIRDVELFGLDIFSALEAASNRTPSAEFKQMLEGFIATIRSGGSLTKYLMARSRQYMKLKRIAMRRFFDNLGILAEFYVTLFVAGPLLFVVMLAVMAMLGEGGQGLLNPRLLLYLLTYLGIPLGSIVFLIILDVVSPRR